MGIIGALVIPSFLNSSNKAKLTSDIESARILQNSIDLYVLQEGDFEDTADFVSVIKALYDNGYIKQNSYSAQTKGINYTFEPTTNSIYLDESSKIDEKTQALIKNLNDNEKIFIKESKPTESETP